LLNEVIMEAHFSTKTKMIEVRIMEIDGDEEEVPEDFTELVEDLCGCDGFFAIPQISDEPIVQLMIKHGLVKHTKRGCYATDELRKIKNELIEAFQSGWYV
jgi:hypothetical protein